MFRKIVHKKVTFMKKILMVAFLLLTISGAQAQGYSQALGLRAAWITPGLEYRYYTGDKHSLRALLSFRGRGVQIHALTEFYQYDLFPFSEQLVFFYGGGLHAGVETWNERADEDSFHRMQSKSSFLTGLDGLIGVEYVFYEAPVTIGVEMKPFFDIFGRNGFDVRVFDFALTVKYLF